MFSNRSPFNQPAPGPLTPYGEELLKSEPPPLPQDDPGAQPEPLRHIPPGMLDGVPLAEQAALNTYLEQKEQEALQPRSVAEIKYPSDLPAPISAQQAEYQWQRDQLTKIIARLDVATESKADLAESLRRHQAAIMQLINGGIAHLDFLGAGLVNLSNEDSRAFADELGNLRRAVAAFHLMIPLALPSERQDAAE